MLCLRSLFLAGLLCALPGLVQSQAASSGDSDAVTHSSGYLGVAISSFAGNRDNPGDEPAGARVQAVQDGSPAARCGLEEDDLIVSLNGKAIGGPSDLGALVRTLSPGSKAMLEVVRDGKKLHLKCILGARSASTPVTSVLPLDPSSFGTRTGERPTAALRWYSTVLGIDYEGVESQLAQYFGVSKGLLVRSVRDGSLASAAGLRAGDVLIKVNERAVPNPRELVIALENRDAQGTIPVEFVRDRKQKTVKLAMDSGLPRTHAVTVEPAR